MCGVGRGPHTYSTHAGGEESAEAKSWTDEGRDPDGDDEADVRAHDYGLGDNAGD